MIHIIPFLHLNLPHLESQHHPCLSKIPDEEEIRIALFNIVPLKTPREYDLHAIFLPKTLEYNKGTINTWYQANLLKSFYPRRLGEHTLVPNSKNLTAHMVNHFRPLDLCKTYYKFLSKISVNRIKPHLHSLISPFQGVYISGRQFSYLFLIAQETMNFMKHSKNKDGWMIIKINI